MPVVYSDPTVNPQLRISGKICILSLDYFICDQQELEAKSLWKDLYSTNYPSNHHNNENCGLRIYSGIGVVLLEIIDFHLEEGYDYARVYDGENDQGALLATLNGIAGNGHHYDTVSMTSSGSSLYISYTTDGSVVNTGFHMRYKQAGQ